MLAFGRRDNIDDESLFPLSRCFPPDKTKFSILGNSWAIGLLSCQPGQACARSAPSLMPTASAQVSPPSLLYLLCAPLPSDAALPIFLFFLFYIPLLALSSSLIKYIVSPHKPCLQRLSRTEVAITTTELFASKK